jgi:hypothetical protein
VVDTDEHPRADTSLEQLGTLTPIMHRHDADATVTAGNASGQNDAAALCVVTTAEAAARYGLTPLVRLVSAGVAGCDPRTMGLGPVPATAMVLAPAGLTLDDMDLIELNEAFATQALGVLRTWGMGDDPDRVNVHGSGISLGHPVGVTGARILATLAREMVRRDARYGLETCASVVARASPRSSNASDPASRAHAPGERRPPSPSPRRASGGRRRRARRVFRRGEAAASCAQGLPVARWLPSAKSTRRRLPARDLGAQSPVSGSVAMTAGKFESRVTVSSSGRSGLSFHRRTCSGEASMCTEWVTET